MAIWTLVGLLLEVAATMLGTLGKQLVSYSGKIESQQRARMLKVTGLVVTTAFGPLLDASAYAFAPQAMVAPLNGLDLVWNICFAPFTLGERIHRSHVVGTLLVFLGSMLSTVFGPTSDTTPTLEIVRKTLLSLRLLVYCIIGFCLLVLNLILLRRRPSGVGDPVRGVMLAAQAGCIAGNMFFLSQALSLLRASLSTGDWSAWQDPLPYLLAVAAVVVAVSNIPFMTKALEENDALLVIPVFAGCQIATSCISADVVLLEMKGETWMRTLGYWCCIVLVVLGLCVVARQRKPLPLPSEEEAPCTDDSSVDEDLEGESCKNSADSTFVLSAGVSGLFMTRLGTSDEDEQEESCEDEHE